MIAQYQPVYHSPLMVVGSLQEGQNSSADIAGLEREAVVDTPLY